MAKRMRPSNRTSEPTTYVQLTITKDFKEKLQEAAERLNDSMSMLVVYMTEPLVYSDAKDQRAMYEDAVNEHEALLKERGVDNSEVQSKSRAKAKTGNRKTGNRKSVERRQYGDSQIDEATREILDEDGNGTGRYVDSSGYEIVKPKRKKAKAKRRAKLNKENKDKLEAIRMRQRTSGRRYRRT